MKSFLPIIAELPNLRRGGEDMEDSPADSHRRSQGDGKAKSRSPDFFGSTDTDMETVAMKSNVGEEKK